MRIHQFLLVAMLMLSVPLLALLGGLSVSSWKDHLEDRNSAVTARATASWIDGQVALSLERSLSQVAFALAPADRSAVEDMLAQQRLIVGQHFEDALEQIADAQRSSDSRMQAFKVNANTLLARLAQTRRDLDVALDELADCGEECFRLIDELITVIDQTAAMRAVLDIPSDQISTLSYDTLQLQYLAWEAREFAGRVRTPYVVAAAQSAPITGRTRTLINEHLRLGNQAWITLQNVSERLDQSSPILAAITEARSVYYGDHIALLARMDKALANQDWQSVPSSEAFFDLSTSALGSISNIASVAGQEIENYWRERQAASLTAFWLTTLGSAFAIAVTAIVTIALRAHLVQPIVRATNLLARLASGELEANEEPKGLALLEIRALQQVVERFRMGLSQAKVAERDARTDHLTKLPNRRDIEELFSNGAQDTFQDGDGFFYIDLDEFKPINDSFGHSAGDAVLQQVAQRLLDFAGESHAVWRLGGDEFGLIVRGIVSPNLASHIADQLHEIVCAPIHLAGEELFVGASIGVALHNSSVLHPQDLLSRADIAMFTAKQSPTKSVEIYGDTIQTRRYGHENRREISAALANGEIFPVFQPQFNLKTGEIVGFEALARWRRSDTELMAPSEFMEMVEYFGAQGELDLLVARRTLERMREIHATGDFKPRFSINVSEGSLASREIRNGYLQLFSHFADVARLVTVEVTENALVDRSAQAIWSSLQSFAETGVSLSMDDFGTGYGSFRHLQEYEFDEIKIDRSFVAKVCFDHSSEVIVSGFLDVARGLDASVIAEGVETEEQREKLLELGCEFAQGYLFSKPVHGDLLLKVLENNRQRHAQRTDRPAVALKVLHR
ncbi:MAG: EAL domain-containing protein [Pseudomonadota bacterium]